MTMHSSGSSSRVTRRLGFSLAHRVGIFLLCLFLVGASAVLTVDSALAVDASDEPSAITISPTREKLALDPGQSYNGTFEVFNSGSKPIEFSVYVSPYQISDIDYQNPDFETDAPRTQLSRWVTLGSESVTLEANELTKVPYLIQVPEDVPAGGQYAALFVETRVPDESDSSVVVKSRAGMLLYVTVNGDTREAGRITEERVDWWQPAAPLTSSTTVKNTGNTDFFVSSRIQVSTLFGNEVFESSKQSPVLPDTSRRIALEWAESSPGIYQVTTTTTILGEDQVSSKWVFVLPLGILLGILSGLVLAVGVFWIVRRSRKHKVSRAVEAAVQEALHAERAERPEGERT
ncbi:hypothetical protein XM48_00410 [Leucobacter sp. Ag1]|nr:hypothetical protein XM48_00410 [Leucobacter sp. Ag1]